MLQFELMYAKSSDSDTVYSIVIQLYFDNKTFIPDMM